MTKTKLSNTKFLIILSLLISLLISIIYSNSLTGEFAFDDEFLIVKNKDIRDIQNIKAVLFHSLKIPQRPVTSLSFAVDYHFWGLSPQGYHLSNIIFYITSILLLTILVHLILENRLLTTLFAFFFATHPIHTETVSSLLGRSELLSSIFLTLGFIFYFYFRKKGGKVKILFYLLSVGSYLLAMLSKETGVILVGFIILYELCFLKDSGFSKKIIPSIPFFACAIVYALFWKYSTHFSVNSFTFLSGSFFSKSLMMVKVASKYILRLFFPVNLCAWYSISPASSFLYPKLVILLAVITISLSIYLSYRYSRKLFFFLVWAYLSFIPISNLILIPGSMMAERWVYIASAGFCGLLAVISEKIFNKKLYYIISSALLAAIVLFYSIRTVERNSIFKNNFTIFTDIVRCCPGYAPAHNSLGVVLVRQGKYNQAISEFNLALNIYPNYDRPHHDLGKIYMIQGKTENALREFIKAVKLNSKNTEYRYWLGSAFLKTGNIDKALVEYREFLRLALKEDRRVEKVKNIIASYGN